MLVPPMGSLAASRALVALALAVGIGSACAPAPSTSTPTRATLRGPPLGACPRVSAPRLAGSVTNPELREASGLVASRSRAGLFWVHNDSGHPEQLFGLRNDGSTEVTHTLAPAVCVDWEDITLGQEREGGPWWLWIADTGTNLSKRRRVIVYRAPEPKVGQVARRLPEVTLHPIVYPDAAVHDSETLMFDGVDRALYFVTKTTTGTSEVFRAALPLAVDRDNVLERVATLDTPNTGERGSERTTGGDISPDGRFILIRTYTRALLWVRPPGVSMAEALSREPCNVPLVREQQGEAIAFDAAGRGYYTLSEGDRPPLWYFPLHTQEAP